MQAERAQTRAEAKRAAFESLITYVENQDDRPAYDRFCGEGFVRGSGRVEAAGKHAIAVRMKRSGMRWPKAGSQKVLSLPGVWLNEDWNRLWNARLWVRPASILPLS